MSNAEEKAMQYCCTKCANNKLNCGMKLISNGRNCIECSNYIEGYRQAEKDLELTWKDMELIYEITYEDSRNVSLNKGGDISKEEFYQEVLKRFKNLKK
jgi:hypothetical protein